MRNGPHRRGMRCDAHKPKPAIMFLALPVLIFFEPFRLIGCGFVWCWRLTRWLLTPPRVVWVAFALPWVVVFHVVWFVHGWSGFHPLCRDREDPWREWSELMGPMTVEATEEYHDLFVSWLGPDSVRRHGEHDIDVRPALRMIPTDYLWNISRQVAEVIAKRRGVAIQPGRRTQDCDFIEEMLMEGGAASRHSEGWGYWPYNVIKDNSTVGRYLVFYHCSDRPPRC